MLPSHVVMLVLNLTPHKWQHQLFEKFKVEVCVRPCSYTKLFQMDWDVQCEKCGVKFKNKNHRKKHIRYPCGDEVRFCFYMLLSDVYRLSPKKTSVAKPLLGLVKHWGQS